MRVPVFVHHIGSGYGNPALGGDDRAWPISEVWGKTNDGLGWQATWDRHAAAISGLEAVRHAAHEVYAPQGIRYRPWGVVHGRWPQLSNYAEREGRLAASIGRAAARPGAPAVYVVDLEPHDHGGATPQFWRDDLGAGAAEARAYLDAYVAAGGDEVWVVPDARDPHLTPVAFEAWAAHPAVTLVAPQVYFTDFVRPRQATAADVHAALDSALRTLGAHGWGDASRVWPVLPGDAIPQRMTEAIAYAHQLGCGGVAVWQRATLRADTATAIAALPGPWAALPPGPSVPATESPPGGLPMATGDEAIRAHLVRARAELAAATALLERRA